MSTAPPTTLAPTTLAPTTLAPTTLAPTTLAPTTLATSLAPTTLLTTVAPTNIDCGPIEITFSIYVVPSYSPPALRDETKDQWFNCGPIEITFGVLGEQKNHWINCGPIEITFSVLGDDMFSTFNIDSGAIPITITLHHADFLVDGTYENWVKWSHVGYLNFVIDESNVAGERPTDWRGWVYDILKLKDRVVVYGENGVSLFIPSGTSYGMDTIHRLGLLGKDAVCGTDKKHFFVNILGELHKLAVGEFKKLDYKEYLSVMTDPVLTYDKEKDLVYICDDTYGYVYCDQTGSFGQGPINVTGIGARDGTLMVVAPTTIAVPTLEICTDVYDLGTRKPKTLHWLELGTDLTEHLEASVDYRVGNRDTFKQIGWHLVNPSGMAFPKCYGVEFRFRIRSFIYEYLELDYIKIGGGIHNFSYRDYRSM